MRLTSETFDEPSGEEVEVYLTVYENRLPLMLEGPTGRGTTRFIQYMSRRLRRPLMTVCCHDDLTASDLAGRYLIEGGETAMASRLRVTP